MSNKKLISVLLVVCMLVIMCPQFAFASFATQITINEKTGMVAIENCVDEHVSGQSIAYIVVPAAGKTYADFAASVTTEELSSSVSYMGYANVSENGWYEASFCVPGVQQESAIYVSYNGKVTNINENSENTLSKRLVINGSVEYVEDAHTVTVTVLSAGHTASDYDKYGNDIVVDSKTVEVDIEGNFEYVLSDAKDVLCSSIVIFDYAGQRTSRMVDASEIVIVCYVDANNGSDTNSGADVSCALRTIDAAKEYYALYAQAGYSGEIILCDGEYPGFSADVNPVGNARLEYKALGGADAVITNATKLPLSAFRRVSDADVLARIDDNAKGNVYEIDLTKYSITQADIIGTLESWGCNYELALPSVYLDGKPQTIAKWPNSGYASLNVSEVVEGEVYSFIDTEFSSWTDVTNAYLEGFFNSSSPWIREYARADSINPADSTIVFAKPSYGAIGERELANTRTCEITVNNVLEALDIPGEWYIDADTMKLYYYMPPYTSESDTLEITINNQPAIKASDIYNVSFSNLHIKGSRAELIKFSNADNVELKGCIVENGQFGIDILSGRNNVIDSNAFRYILGTAISIRAGADAETLKESGNRITNNHVYHCATSGTHGANNYTAAIRIGRSQSRPVIIGDVVENNLVHATPYGEAVLYTGVEISVSNNEFYNLLQYVSDAGVVYSGNRLNMYGNKIDRNYIYDFGHTLRADTGSNNVAIYWDDYLSGQSAESNIIIGNNYDSRGLLTVGRDSSANGNLVVGAKTGMVFSDRNIDNFNAMEGDSYKYFAYASLGYVSDALAARYPQILATKKSIDEDAKNHFHTDGNTADGNMHVDVRTVTSASTALDQKINQFDLTTTSATASSATDSFNNTTCKANIDYSDIFVDHNNHDWRIKESFVKQYSGKLSSRLPLETNFSMDGIGLVNFANSFETDKAFSLAYPVNRTVEATDTVTLAWQKALYADRYTYEVARDAQFADIVSSGTTRFSSAVVTGLTQGVTYYWRVTAHNDSKEMGDSWEGTSTAAFTLGYADYKVENVRFFTAQDTEVTDMEDFANAAYITYDFVNRTQQTVDYDIIVSLYNGDGSRMKQVLTYAMNQSADAGTTRGNKVTLERPADYNSGDLVYVFTWDNGGSVNPIARKIIIE